MDVAIELAGKWTAMRDLRARQLARSGERANVQGTVPENRASLYNLLASVVPDSSPDRAAIDEYGRGVARTVHAANASLGALRTRAQALLTAAAKDEGLAEYLTDKGLTAARLAALTKPASEAMCSADAHVAIRRDIARAQHALDVLDGRLRDQLLRLRRHVEAARARGAALPALDLAFVRAAPSRGETDVDPTPPAPTPTPVPALAPVG